MKIGGRIGEVPRLRVVLFGLSSALAFGLGFLAVSPSSATALIKHGGYYYMLAVFVLFLWSAKQVCEEMTVLWRAILRSPVPWLIIGASLILIWMDPFKHKVLFDEYVLQGTAFHMHATKEVGTVIRAYDIQGTWLPIDTFLDKRPYFFTFLLSLLHDFSGYRIANIYILNVLFVPGFLALLYYFARALMSERAAVLPIVLMATLPLLGQQASGAGMELHNLTMLLVVAVGCRLYLETPTAARLSFLILGTILLAQSRYESVIFVVPIAAVVVLGWWRAGRIMLPVTALIGPLLLVPYAWHSRIVSSTPMLWQLGEGQTSRFSATYLADNLAGAWTFLFDRSGALPNSWYLSAIGLIGLVVGLLHLGRWSRNARYSQAQPAVVALVAISISIIANLTLLMFYYWSRFDDVVASRFALPLCMLFALFAGKAADQLRRRQSWVLPSMLGGAAVWFIGWGVPATAQRLYTSQNLVMQELEWEHDELRRQDSSLLFITNKSTIPFVLWRIPSVINGQARSRGGQIAFHLREGTFKDVIVAQALRPTSAQGELGIAPEDLLPPGFRLERITERRFGARWARLSRLVAIDGLWERAAGAGAGRDGQ